MSDREGRSGPSDDELSLPRATVAKMIQGAGHLLIFHFSSLPSILFNAPPPSGAGDVPYEIVLSSHSCPPPRDDLELLPEDITCAKDTRDLVIECCVGKTKIPNIYVALILTSCSAIEFIHLLSSEANEICEKESKKTIAPEHIISALQVLLSKIARLSPD
jgi:hypothetical protein